MIPVREQNKAKETDVRPEVDGGGRGTGEARKGELAGRTETGGQDLGGERHGYVPARAREKPTRWNPMRKIPCLQAAHAWEPGTCWEAGRQQRVLGGKGWHIQLQEEDGRRGESSPEVLMTSTLVHCGFLLGLCLHCSSPSVPPLPLRPHCFLLHTVYTTGPCSATNGLCDTFLPAYAFPANLK